LLVIFFFGKRWVVAMGLWVVVSMAVAGRVKSAFGQSPPSESAEGDKRAAWQSSYELRLPDASAAPWIDFLLPSAVFGKARSDLADLRIFDGRGREVPYAVRVLRKQSREQELPAPRQVKQVKNEDRSIEVVYDLGDNPPSHRMIEAICNGGAFCRPAQLAGCDDAELWNALLSNAWLSQYRVESQAMYNCKLRYPDCRFRYLRLRVYPDPGIADDRPGIELVKIYHGDDSPSELVTAAAILGPRETVTTDTGAASAWSIDLGDARMPFEQLTFDVADTEFTRPYVLEKVENAQTSWPVARGELQRAAGENKPIEIGFDTEIVARRLRLVVQDKGQSPLQLKAVQFAAPARQVIFARNDELVKPLRLYVGNPRAEAPSYAFAKDLPEVLDPAPARATLMANGGPADGSGTSGFGWAIYLGLAAIVVILFGLLAWFGRKLLGRRA
jgi:hypothetical protein